MIMELKSGAADFGEMSLLLMNSTVGI